MDKKAFIRGAKASLPIFLGYLPLGITLGISARAIGFLLGDMFAMSALVYAGSAQFIGIKMIGAGVNFISIIATTFFINLRHFIMSSAYAPYFPKEKTSKLALVSFGITDETFAIAIIEAKSGRDIFSLSYLFGLETFAWLSWLFSTCVGLLLGGFIPFYERLGLEFALYAMFIGLIAALVNSKTHLVVCIISGIVSIFLFKIGFNNFNVIIAAILVSFAAVGVKYAGK